MKPFFSQRLINQQIAATNFSNPAEIVAWMVAMQAQEYAQSKWSIGLRLPGTRDVAVEKALTDGLILRTHLLRPTWHFVAAADIRWLLALTAPRVHAANAFMYRKTGLDSAVFKRSNDAIAKTLEGGKCLTRPVLKTALDQAGIVADGFRLSYLMMQAELEGIIDGVIAGTWKTTGKNNAGAETSTFLPLEAAHKQAVKAAVHRYCSFASET